MEFVLKFCRRNFLLFVTLLFIVYSLFNLLIPLYVIHAQTTETYTPRVLFIGFDPTDENGISLANTYFSSHMNGKTAEQFEPEFVSNLISTFSTLSQGNIQYQLAGSMRITDFPTYPDGSTYTVESYKKCVFGDPSFNPTECDNRKWTFPYVSWVQSHGICEEANRLSVDEIWILSDPYIAAYEAFMIAPNGGFWVNGPSYVTPVCNKRIIAVNGTYERPDLFLHSYGHRIEATMNFLMSNWKAEDKKNYWERFAAIQPATRNSGQPYCGNAHVPSNVTSEYDYSNAQSKESTCSDFSHFPEYTSQQETISCSAWGCSDRGWQSYWFSFIPRNSGEATLTSINGKSFSFKKDWWFYLLYPENAVSAIQNPVYISPTPSATITQTPTPTATMTPTLTQTSTPTPTPTQTESPNVVPNNSFETITNGWANNWTRSNTKFSIDTTTKGDAGTNALRASGNITRDIYVLSALIPVNQTIYTWKQFVKINTITGGELGFYIDEYDANGEWISGQWKGEMNIGFSGYKEFAYTPTSTDVSKIGLQFYITRASNINIFIDSVSLTTSGTATATPTNTATPTVTTIPTITQMTLPTTQPSATQTPSTGGNIIKNGSFETVQNSFPLDWNTDGPTIYTLDTTSKGNNGANTIYVKNTTNAKHLFSTFTSVEQVNYTWTTYIKALSITGEFGFYIDEYDASGNWISGQWKGAITKSFSGTRTFTYRPTNTKVKSIGLQYYATSNSKLSLYLDSVALVK